MKPPFGSTKADLAEFHAERMRNRKAATARRYAEHQRKAIPDYRFPSAGINRHTGEPHEDAQEIARRSRQRETRA